MWFSGPIEVIPAVDVLGEEAVRLHRGDHDSVVERADSPAALARRCAAAGAARIHLVVVDTAAWPDPSPWLERGDALVLALDVRDGEVRVAGWTEGTGLAFERALELAGAARVLVTAIDRDGTLAGPDVELVETAAARGLRVLAAGGVRSPADVEALAAAGA